MNIKELIKNGPMLAVSYDRNKLTFPCFAQPKYDGERALYCNGDFFTRKGKRWADDRFVHIKRELARFVPPDFIIDGELYIHKMKFQDQSSILSIQNKEPHPDEYLVTYRIFDRCVEHYKFEDRLKQLYNIMADSGIGCTELEYVRIAPVDVIFNSGHADVIYNEHLMDGYEGSIYRVGLCPYEMKRCNWLVKRKKFDTCMATVIDTKPGKGKYESFVGALVCRANIEDRIVEFSVGSGFSDDERIALDNKIPEYITVEYQGLSKAGIPLKPIYKGVA